MAHKVVESWRMPEAGEELSAYLAKARHYRGATWDDLVKSTDLSLGTIRKIEEGRTLNPGVFTLLRLWRALELPIEGILLLAQPPGKDPRHDTSPRVTSA